MPVSPINKHILSLSQVRDLLKSHRNYWLLSFVFLGANLLFYIFFVGRQTDQIDHLQQRYQTQRQGLTAIRKRQSRAANYAVREKAWHIFQKTIASKITFPDRLTDLETLFRHHHLSPDGMIFKSEQLVDLQLVRFTSAIAVEGNYADLKALLNGIWQLPGLFCIDHLSIDKNRKAGTLVMKFKLAAYFSDASGAGQASD